MSDKELIERFLSGDDSALGEIYNRYKTEIVRYIHSWGCGDDTEDVLHETFIKAFLYPSSYNPDFGVKRWLLSLCRQRIISRYIKNNAMKRKAVEISMDEERDMPMQVASDQRNPEQILESKMEVEQIHKKLSQLSGLHKETVDLRRDGRGYQEIAELLNIPLGTVKSRIYRARQAL